MPIWEKQLIIYDNFNDGLFYNKELESFIIKSLKFIKEYMIHNNFDIAYDIADILHTLPQIIILK